MYPYHIYTDTNKVGNVIYIYTSGHILKRENSQKRPTQYISDINPKSYEANSLLLLETLSHYQWHPYIHPHSQDVMTTLPSRLIIMSFFPEFQEFQGVRPACGLNNKHDKT